MSHLRFLPLCASALVTSVFVVSAVPGCGGGGSDNGSNGNASRTPTPNVTSSPAPNRTTTASPVVTASPVASASPVVTASPVATVSPTATALPPLTPVPTGQPVGVVLLFDSFLFDNGGQPANDFNAFFEWNVTEGSVDLRGGRVPGANDQTNGRFVDLDGGNAGRFASRVGLLLQRGRRYNIRFSYFSPDGTFNAAFVTLGGQRYGVSTRSRSLQQFDRTFTAGSTGPSPLAFQDNGNDDNGLGIDNVVVTQLP